MGRKTKESFETLKKMRGEILKADLKNEGETVIVDGQGYYHDGMYCHNHCMPCPYWVADINDSMACYLDQYKQCQFSE